MSDEAGMSPPSSPASSHHETPIHPFSLTSLSVADLFKELNVIDEEMSVAQKKKAKIIEIIHERTKDVFEWPVSARGSLYAHENFTSMSILEKAKAFDRIILKIKFGPRDKGLWNPHSHITARDTLIMRDLCCSDNKCAAYRLEEAFLKGCERQWRAHEICDFFDKMMSVEIEKVEEAKSVRKKTKNVEKQYYNAIIDEGDDDEDEDDKDDDCTDDNIPTAVQSSIPVGIPL